MIESGIYEKQINDMIFDGEFCLNPENQKVDLMPLQMTDVLGVFSLYGAGKSMIEEKKARGQNNTFMGKIMRVASHFLVFL